MSTTNPVRANPFSAASVGSTLGKVARSFQQGRTGSRIFRSLSAGTNTFLAVVRRLGRVLWLEVTGFIFLSFSVIGCIACSREYRAFASGRTGASRVVVSAVFSFIFAYFGITSFWSARKG